MESRIFQELRLRYQPVAVLFTNQRPSNAMQFVEGRRGCVIAMLNAAAKGKVTVFDRKTAGCIGGEVGLGFGNSYPKFPGGIDYFLSTGRGEGYMPGEGYKKSPELAQKFAEQLPMTDIPFQYVVFKPLEEVDPAKEVPELVVFYANADQLSALVVLANFNRDTSDNVIIPFGAGCQNACLVPYNEGQSDKPRAVVGLTDITVRPIVDADLLSFTVPFAMYQEMEDNIQGSFIEKHLWHKIRERITT